MDDDGKTREELLRELKDLRRQLAEAEQHHQLVINDLRDEHRFAEADRQRRLEPLNADCSSGACASRSGLSQEIRSQEYDGDREDLLAMVQKQAEELEVAHEELAVQNEELLISNEELITQAELLEEQKKELEEQKQELEHLSRNLKAERVLLTSILEQMPAGVVIAAAPAGPILLSNRLAEKTWLQPPGFNIDLESYWKIPRFRPDGRPYRLEEIPLRRSLTVGEVVMGEEMSFRPEGGPPIHISVNSAPVRDDHDAIVAGVVTYSDITARKVAEASIQKLASFPQLNPNPVLELDLTGAVTYYNQATEKALEPLGEDAGPEAFFPEDLKDILIAARKQGKRRFYRVVRVKDSVYAEDISYAEPLQVIRIYARNITERQAAEEALKESEARYRSLVELSPEAILVIAEGKYIFANQAAADLFGATAPAQMLGQDVLALVPEDFREFVSRRINEVLAGDREYKQEAQILRLDGQAVDVEASGAAIYYQGEKAILLILKNISESKRVIKALQDSREDLNRAQAVAQTGSWRLDMRRNSLVWSDETYRIFGIPQRAGMTYELFLAAVHPEDRDYVDQKWTAALGGEPYDIEHRIVVGDSVKWVRERAELEFDPQGNLLGGFGTVQDITARKQAEEALQQAHDELEQRVRERTLELRDTVAQLIEEVQERQRAEQSLSKQAQLLELAQEAIIVRDLDSRVIFWNRGAEQTYGWTRDQARGQIIHALLKTQFSSSCQEVEQDLLQAGQWYGELIHTRADGEEIVVASRQVVQRNDGGAPVAILEINRDTTARRRAEKTLENERQRFFTVLERIPAHVSLLRPDFTFAFVNGEYIRRFGEPVGKRCYELLGQQNPCKECQAMAVFHTGKPAVWEWAGTDGKSYQVYDYPFTDVDGSPLVLEMGVDISARKQAEEQTKSLGRMYRMLSKVNENIVRVSNKEELFREICRIMMEEGDFLLAWIGTVDPAARVIRSAAQYDLNDDYAQNFRIPLEDVPEGRGPTGIAVREGRYDVCHDIAGEPRMAPWREAALARGFRSSAAFPLRVGSGVVGALTVYSGKPGFFTADEIALLESLADNLSFALEFLDRDAKRREVEEFLRESEERLRYLASRLLHAQENERRRLALELHDDLGQSLMVLKMQIRSIEKTIPPEQWKTREECVHSLAYLNSVVDNVRRIARNLRPSVLEDLGLSAGLRVLVEEFSRYHEVEVSLKMDDIEGLFTRGEEINLYRIFQETLTNIAKHAQAKRISMVISRLANEVSFKVTDDGVGFDLEQVMVRNAAERGLGLAALEERAHMLGGSLTIKSQEGQGTEISFTIPLFEKRLAH